MSALLEDLRSAPVVANSQKGVPVWRSRYVCAFWLKQG